MKQIFLFFILVFSQVAYSQGKVENELEELVKSSQYDKIIEQYTKATKDFSARSLHLIAVAYHMKEDDKHALEYINASLAKDSTKYKVHYLKGYSLNYLGGFREAISSFNSGIRINNTDADLYEGLGDAHFQLKEYQPALKAFEEATKKENWSDRCWYMIAQMHYDLNNKGEALKANYVTKSKIDKASGYYKNTLFNIGLMESQAGNYDKAETAFSELLELDPKDYHVYAKLAQISYYRKDYAKGNVYKRKLYEAKNKGELKDELGDMFCYDQFKWKDKLIQAFERYEEKSTKIFNKHIFFVVDKDGEVEYSVQTEYSPISVEMGGAKYVLCKSQGNQHWTFNVGFNDNFKYDDLKKSVIDVLEGKITAGASSRIGN
jgi:tetratricopeptide (TPR) repeat protein